MRGIISLVFLTLFSISSWGSEILSFSFGSLFPENVITVNLGGVKREVCYVGDNIRLTTPLDKTRNKYEWIRIALDLSETVVATNDDYVITSADNIGLYKLKVYSKDPVKEAIYDGGFEKANDANISIGAVGFPVQYFEDVAKTKLLFTTDYKYGPSADSGKELYGEGTHRVGSSANTYHPNFVTTGPHSVPKMLIANGAANQTTRVWFKQVEITPNTKYAFSVWGLSVNPMSPAKLAFFVTDNVITNDDIANHTGQIGKEFTFDSAATWKEFFVMWESGAFNGSKILTVVNTNIALGGNDFAIDDVSFCGVSTVVSDVDVRITPSITGNTINNISPCIGSSTKLEINTNTLIDSYSWTKDGVTLANTTKDIDVNTPTLGNYTYVGKATNFCGNNSVTYNLSVKPLIRTEQISRLN